MTEFYHASWPPPNPIDMPAFQHVLIKHHAPIASHLKVRVPLYRIGELRLQWLCNSDSFECSSTVAAVMTKLEASPPLIGHFGPSVRRRSSQSLLGIPLVDVAYGPDAESGESFGRPCGIVAFGDMPVGVIAIGRASFGMIAVGGAAFGVVALGGVAAGAFALGGLALALFVAVGGMAIGGVALGGCAIGFVAIGGCAIGYYAIGGAAIGIHTIGPGGNSPQAIEFFTKWFPAITDAIRNGKPR
jgi:hypothetical protein